MDNKDKKENQDEIEQRGISSASDAIAATVDDLPAASDSLPPVDVAPPAPTPAGGVTAGEKRKRGRPKKDEIHAIPQKPQSKNTPHINGIPKPAPVIGSAEAGTEAAAQTALMLINLSGMALGGEDAAMRPEEAKIAQDGLVYYFKRKGVHDVPVWVVMAGALMPYYMRVITTTPAKNKVAYGLRAVWGGCKRVFKRVTDARFNRGDDNERKDNAGAKNGGKNPE
jgi:hypothetical protein